MDSSFTSPPPMQFTPSQMPTGLEAEMIVVQQRATAFFSVPIQFPGVVENNKLLLVQVRRPNTKLSPILLQNYHGSYPYVLNWDYTSPLLLPYGVTTMELHTYPPILFIMQEPNMSK
jgi:hypothetical protein